MVFLSAAMFLSAVMLLVSSALGEMAPTLFISEMIEGGSYNKVSAYLPFSDKLVKHHIFPFLWAKFQAIKQSNGNELDS